MHSPQVANKGNKKVKPSHDSNCSYRKMTKKEEERNEKRKEDAFCKAKRRERELHKAMSVGRSMS